VTRCLRILLDPAFFIFYHTAHAHWKSLPGVLVVGGEASGVGGLGDLAVVDLLEGVEALAGGRHGVHEMHGGGSLFGGVWGLKVGGMRSSGLVSYRRSRVRVWLSF
jgi:hypothetical protein